MTNYEELAHAQLEKVAQNRAHLDDLYRIPPEARDTRKVAGLHSEIGEALKLAEIHALLFVGSAIQDVWQLLDSRLRRVA